MKRNRKQIGLVVDDVLYCKLKAKAQLKHMPLSTYVKLILVNNLEGVNDDGK